MRLLLALCALLAAGSAVRADDYTTSLGGPSKGAVMERRQGTTGSVAVPIDDLNPMAITSTSLSTIAANTGAGTYADGSAAMSTAAADVFGANSSRVRIKLINTDYVTTGGGAGITIWCRWGTAAGAAASSHGTGSFPLLPGGGIDDTSSGINRSAVNCIAESGTPKLLAEQY